MAILARGQRFGKFNLVGLLGAALQVILLWALTRWFHLSIIAATLLAVEIVVLHNFVWHMKFTWRDRALKTAREKTIALLRFHAGNACISMIGNTIVMYLLTQRCRMPVLPSSAAAIAACAILNFLVADRWVYPLDNASVDRYKSNCYNDL